MQLTVMGLITSVSDDGDLNGLEDVGQIEVSAVEGSPAGNDGGAGSELLILLGQGDGLDLAAEDTRQCHCIGCTKQALMLQVSPCVKSHTI